MKNIILTLALVFSSIATAMNTGGYFKISKIWSWADHTNGVVLIQLENQNPLCPNGYWFEASKTSSATNILGIALSAYHAKTPVMIYANESSDWSGLSAKECELKLIVLE